ncbi:mechanosensitive ion channel family protein [Egbenema bharatensis]|uniref:mechanosensitive ion channel family protein n=1 Tax=Egbenema bharatensis TaxID=3463334 RepID=UPI003A88153A
MTTSHVGHAQFSLPNDFGQSNSVDPPRNVSRYGSFETTSVTSPLNGRTLFTIASSTVHDRSMDASASAQRVEARAEEIHDRLWLAITRFKDPQTLVVEVSQLNNVTIIVARDEEFTRPLVLVSVTDLDADFNGKPIETLAAEWRSILQQELEEGVNQFSVDALSRYLGKLAQTVLGLMAATGMIFLGKYSISRRQAILRQRKQGFNESTAANGRSAGQLDGRTEPQSNPFQGSPEEQFAAERTQLLQRLRRTFKLEQQLGLFNLLQWLLFWLLILIWYWGIFWFVSNTPGLLQYKASVLGLPIELLGIWFLTGLTIRISLRLIDRLKMTWENYNFVNFIDLGDTQRRKLRTSTIAGAVKGLVTVLIATTGLLWILRVLGIPTGSILAIGGLLGLAVSFGSQSLVKDLVNGVLILAEDQYAIGDVIDLGRVSGLVENLNLRITQLRSGDGELITIPNSAITEVKNLTRTWSRVNFSIDVAYQTDPEKALSVLREVAQELYHDPEWHDKILDLPEVLGIDSVSHSGMTITTWIQTVPIQQWAVGREFRLRVRKALEANGIKIGIPQQTHVLDSSPIDLADGKYQTEMPSEELP